MKDITIKCPKCGRSYLPAEIYYPKEFFGNVSNIVKNSEGNVIYYNGDNMNLSEDYTCDNCNCTFTVTAEINFETTVNEIEDFSEDEYSTAIYNNRITMKEPEEEAEVYDLFRREEMQ